MSKYTTRDLKREVDRLNKEYKKTDRTAIKFVFGKDKHFDDYYIAVKDNEYSKKYDGETFEKRLSVNKDIGRVIEEVSSKEFKKRNKRTIDYHNWLAMSRKASRTKEKKTRYIK